VHLAQQAWIVTRGIALNEWTTGVRDGVFVSL